MFSKHPEHFDRDAKPLEAGEMMPLIHHRLSRPALPGLARLALAAFFLCLLSSPAQAACVCKEEARQYGSCTFTIKVCGCLDELEWTYSAEATRNAPPNETGRSTGKASISEAIDTAVQDAFDPNPQLQVDCYA